MMCNWPGEDLLVCIMHTLLLKYKKKITLSIISKRKRAGESINSSAVTFGTVVLSMHNYTFKKYRCCTLIINSTEVY